MCGSGMFSSKIRQELVVDLSREGVVNGLVRGYKGAVYDSSRVSKVVEIYQALVVLGGYVLRPIESVRRAFSWWIGVAFIIGRIWIWTGGDVETDVCITIAAAAV